MPNCNKCALQYQEACPYPFGTTENCTRFAPKSEKPPSPPSKGRSKPEPGEYIPEEWHLESGPKKTKKSSRKQQKGSNNTANKSPAANNRWQRLFYRNNMTGIIEFGFVIKEDGDQFLFRFGNRNVWLSYEAIGTRLFFSHDGARAYYKRQMGE